MNKFLKTRNITKTSKVRRERKDKPSFLYLLNIVHF